MTTRRHFLQTTAAAIAALILPRCLFADQVVVHHWASHQADLRPFFKQHRLARQEIEVALIDRKKEITITKTGDSFLFGVPLAADFPLDLFQNKFASRFTKDADDWQPAPGTSSGFAWANVEDGCIPWAALKSAWRRAGPGVCLNCSEETLLVNFGLRQGGLFNRAANFVGVCSKCCRAFRDDSITDVWLRIVENLDAEVRPDAEIVWGRRVKLEPPNTMTS